MLALLVSAGAAWAQEPDCRPPRLAEETKASKRGFRRAQVFGAAAGVVLGLALRERGPSGPALSPLGHTDAAIAGSAVLLALSPRLFPRHGAPWRTSPDAAPQPVNAFDRGARGWLCGNRGRSQRHFLDALSMGTLSAAIAAPLTLLATSRVDQKWKRDVPVLLEASALSIGMAVAVKHVVHRSRPASRFCVSEPGQDPCPPDTRLSFYSGHSTTAATMAVAAGILAGYHGFGRHPWVWGSGAVLAASTGALRVMADQHYATDVITGLAAGGAAGWLVPRLHEPGRSRRNLHVELHWRF